MATLLVERFERCPVMNRSIASANLQPRAGAALLLLCASLVSACAQLGVSDARELSSEKITQIVASADRTPADRNNDLRRKPEQMLAFLRLRPGMTAFDLSTGGGYTAELLARAVGPSGQVYGQSQPPRVAALQTRVAPEGNSAPNLPSLQPTPNAPAPVRRTVVQVFEERSKNAQLSNLIPIIRVFEDPIPAQLAGQIDLVTLMFNYHDLVHMGIDRARMNVAVFSALKPGGIYVIADHAGRSGTGISEAGTLHRIEEAFLRKEVEAAGFKLHDEGHFLRNPSDPRDKNTPDPAQPKDEFVLKFVKP